MKWLACSRGSINVNSSAVIRKISVSFTFPEFHDSDSADWEEDHMGHLLLGGFWRETKTLLDDTADDINNWK